MAPFDRAKAGSMKIWILFQKRSRRRTGGRGPRTCFETITLLRLGSSPISQRLGRSFIRREEITPSACLKSFFGPRVKRSSVI